MEEARNDRRGVAKCCPRCTFPPRMRSMCCCVPCNWRARSHAARERVGSPLVSAWSCHVARRR
eukprot:11933919-Alexandrium_andersonii.AAC.1